MIKWRCSNNLGKFYRSEKMSLTGSARRKYYQHNELEIRWIVSGVGKKLPTLEAKAHHTNLGKRSRENAVFRAKTLFCFTI